MLTELLESDSQGTFLPIEVHKLAQYTSVKNIRQCPNSCDTVHSIMKLKWWIQTYLNDIISGFPFPALLFRSL
jgi:hypothetical protein